MNNTENAGTWETIKAVNSPSARHENGFVDCDGKFYLIGGRGIKPVDEFDPATNSWRALSPPPLELHHFLPVSIDGTIYIIGAMTGGYPRETPVEHIYTYRPADDAWARGPVIPAERRRGSCGTAVRNGKIYLVCGIKDGHHSGGVTWFDCYDPTGDTWTVLPDAPRVRDHFPVVNVGQQLYAVGGRNTSVHTENDFAAFFGATIREVDYYDFEQKSWFMLNAPLPVGTAAGGGAYLEGKLIYFGGESYQQTAHAETQCYDFESQAWTSITPMQRGRHGSQAVVYDNAAYIVAGCGNRGGSPELDSIERFSF